MLISVEGTVGLRAISPVLVPLTIGVPGDAANLLPCSLWRTVSDPVAVGLLLLNTAPSVVSRTRRVHRRL